MQNRSSKSIKSVNFRVVDDVEHFEDDDRFGESLQRPQITFHIKV